MVSSKTKIRFLFGFLPAVVISSPGGKGRKKTFDAITRGICVQIRSDGDPVQLEALELHELEHVRQCYMTLGLDPILYTHSAKYRLWAESRAMRKQLDYLNQHDPAGDHISMLAGQLSANYFLDISPDEALQILDR